MRWQDTPIFIPNRDNLERGFRRLLAWLQSAGMTRIVVIDNGSTYEPLLHFYATRPPRIEIHFAQRNLGPGAPWSLRMAGMAMPTRFIVSDPDVVPAPECPRDLVRALHAAADIHQAKVGPGLRIDNLPDSYVKKGEVLAAEKPFWTQPEEGNFFAAPVFRAPIDTTFALYAPGSGRWPREPHFRLGPPYLMEHVPWYEDSAAALPERDFYRRTATRDWNHW